MQDLVNTELSWFYARTALYISLCTVIALLGWAAYKESIGGYASGFSLYGIAGAGLILWLTSALHIKVVIAPKIRSGDLYFRKFWSNF